MAKKKHSRAHRPVSTASAPNAASSKAQSVSGIDTGSATVASASKPSEDAQTAASTAESYAAAALEPPAPGSAVVSEEKPADQSASASVATGPNDRAEAQKTPAEVTKATSTSKPKTAAAADDGVPDRWDGGDDSDVETVKGPPTSSAAPGATASTGTTAGPPAGSAESAADYATVLTALASAPTEPETLKEATPKSPSLGEKASRRIVPQPTSSRQRSPNPPSTTQQSERPKRNSQAPSLAKGDKRRVANGVGSEAKDTAEEFDFDAKQRAEAGAATKRPRREEAAKVPPAKDGEDVPAMVSQATVPDAKESKKKKSVSAVEKHVKFFDRYDRGIISPFDTFVGFRALGFNLLLSLFSAVVIHLGFSWPSKGYGFPDLTWTIRVEGMPGCKHGSDSGTYDTDGEFVEQKFQAIWERYSRDGESMSKYELWNMTASHRLVFDPFGWAAQIFEWLATWLLLADAHGKVYKADVKDLYSGDLFYKIASKRRHSGKNQKA